ncbi:MAG: hypothetical protein Q7K40_01005 [bacterium]|nr:hypothetical protein [bacterium]
MAIHFLQKPISIKNVRDLAKEDYGTMISGFNLKNKYMFEKNTLFYAANIEPEIARMFKAHDQGHTDIAKKFQARTLDMISKILSSREISPAGREEWFAVQNLVRGYDNLDSFSRQVLLSFGKPFSEKFMRGLS